MLPAKAILPTALTITFTAVLAAQDPPDLPPAINTAVGLGGPPPKEVTDAIENGLRWLAQHQHADGSFPADRPERTVASTALAMLAFLGDGNTLRAGPHREPVKKATTWLRAQQDEQGRFGTGEHPDQIVDQAIAAWAMSEAYGLSQYRILKKSTQLGIDWLVRQRQDSGGWGHAGQDANTVATLWAVAACASAANFELSVPDDWNRRAIAFVAERTHRKGRIGFTRKGEPLQRAEPGDQARFAPEHTELPTAAGLLIRYFANDAPAPRAIEPQTLLLLASPPRWDPPGAIDPTYWLFATFALYQHGGLAWRKWQEALRTTVLPRQIQAEGPTQGSWDPVGAFGGQGGRVYATAAIVLCLEAVARYPQKVR